MNRKAGIVVGSLLGAFVLNLIFVACGSSGFRMANAQSQSSCSSWQVSTFYQPSVLSKGAGDWPAGLGTAVNIPNGWEPIEATAWGGTSSTESSTVGALVIVRHCAQ